MKKQALALGLSLAMLVQPVWTSASFAAEQSSDTQQGVPTAQSESYSRSISDEGLELIKSFEGYSRYPVWDYSQYSFGYGSYVDASTVYKDTSSPTGYSTTLYPDGIPEREAAELLREMVEEFNVNLNLFLETYKISLNQNQFDALSSFTYNLGKYIWTQDTTIRKMLISGDYTEEEFTEAYCQWCHAGGQFLQGLYDRRQREMKIFFAQESISDPNADLYVVNATKLYIRSTPSTSGSILSSLSSSQVIRVHSYSADGQWAYTSYCGYFGWVSMGYLVSINEAAMVTQIDSSGKDDQGVGYTFNNLTMTATVGSSAASSNTSGYQGEYAGEIFLTKYLLYKGAIYTLDSISASAFTNCTSIKKIYLPPCITSIGTNAFKGSSLQEILYTKGSYAETWAKASGFTATDYRCRAGHLTADWRIIQKASDTAVQIEQRTCSVCGETQTRQYDHLEIVSYPNKIEYKEGAAFSADGLSLNIVYTDGTKVPAPSFKVSGYDTSKLGTQSVTVGYSTLTTTFNIIITEKTLTGISIASKPQKLSYIEGNSFVSTGLAVNANYDSGVSAPVTEYSISGFDPDKIGTQTITVTYNGFTASFNVTVKAKTLSAFTFSSYPQKLEYFCGEAFDSTGMTLKLSYDNGTVEYVQSGYKISGYNSQQPGVQKIKVSYGSITQTLQAVVILNYLKSDQYSIDRDTVVVSNDRMTVAQFTAGFESGDRVEVLKNGKILPADTIVGTGMTVRLMYNEQIQDTALLVISGDITGDGRCTVSDFVALGDYLTGHAELSELGLSAADFNRDGKIDLADYVELYAAVNKDPGAATLSVKVDE